MCYNCEDERKCSMCGSTKDIMEYEAFFGRYMAAGPDGGTRWCKRCKNLQQSRLDKHNKVKK